MDHVPLPAESSFAGKYRIVRVLREGEASTVYVAEQLSTSTELALEILRPPAPLDEIETARFLRETALATSFFESPLVAPVVDAGVDAGQPWLVTELLEGELLDARIARTEGFAPRAARDLLAQIGGALAAAHQAGVIHGHLTPRRVLLLHTDPDGASLRVLGFGIARLVNRWMERADMDESVAWLSPDQVNGRSTLTPAADVWALGLLAFFMITGKRYWKGTSPMELLREALIDPLPPASQRADERGGAAFPPALDAWFARCVSRDPLERFTDAAAAIDELMRPYRPSRRIEELPRGNPKGSFYDDGLQETFEETDDDDVDDVARGEGAYRKGVRPPTKKRRIVIKKDPDHFIISNPKGSLYDRGHQETPARSRWWVAAAMVFVAAVAAALRILVFRR